MGKQDCLEDSLVIYEAPGDMCMKILADNFLQLQENLCGQNRKINNNTDVS